MLRKNKLGMSFKLFVPKAWAQQGKIEVVFSEKETFPEMISKGSYEHQVILDRARAIGITESVWENGKVILKLSPQQLVHFMNFEKINKMKEEMIHTIISAEG